MKAETVMSRMRVLPLILALVVIVVLPRAVLARAWGGGSGGVTALAIDPMNPAAIYAASSSSRSPWGTVYKSIDGGASWQATGLIRANISVLAIDPSTPTTLYAGTDSGVVKSTDGGVNWHATTLTSNISSLAINPLTPTTIYAARAWDISGQAWSGLFESTDGGATWRELLDSVVPFLAIDPVTPTTLYGSGYSGVIKTTDGGASWTTPIWNSFTGAILSLAIDPVTRNTVYAGTDVLCCDEYSGAVLAPGGVFKSADGGVTWQALVLSDALTAFALAINSLNASTVYVGTGSGVLESTDGGATWQETSLTARNVRALVIDPVAPTTVYAGTDSGVFKSTDGGATWIDSGLVLTEPPAFMSLSLNPTVVFYGAPSIGTVTLATPAPTGGATITLSSSNPASAAVPAIVTVPAGTTRASFIVSVSPITFAVTISATYEAVIAPANLMVYATTLSSLHLSPTGVPGGTPATGTATLNAPAPAGGATIPLSSSDPAVASVPVSVTVPAGANSASFTVFTKSVTSSTTVTISADNFFASLTVTPGPTFSTMSLYPTTVPWGTASAGTVTLSDSAPLGGVTVALSSSNSALATVPGTVTVPAGATSANFTVSTTACASGAVTISGTYGATTRSAGLTVSPGPVDTLTIQQADYFASRRELRIAAKGSNSTARLRVLVTSTGQLIGQLVKGGDGTYRGQFDWPTNPQNITVQSSLCGSFSKAVASK